MDYPLDYETVGDSHAKISSKFNRLEHSENVADAAMRGKPPMAFLLPGLSFELFGDSYYHAPTPVEGLLNLQTVLTSPRNENNTGGLISHVHESLLVVQGLLHDNELNPTIVQMLRQLEKLYQKLSQLFDKLAQDEKVFHDTVL